MVTDLVCHVCKTAAQYLPVVEPIPQGWAVITIVGTPMAAHTLCPEHTTAVRNLLNGLPKVDSEE